MVWMSRIIWLRAICDKCCIYIRWPLGLVDCVDELVVHPDDQLVEVEDKVGLTQQILDVVDLMLKDVLGLLSVIGHIAHLSIGLPVGSSHLLEGRLHLKIHLLQHGLNGPVHHVVVGVLLLRQVYLV
jgi:hypothetical protein